MFIQHGEWVWWIKRNVENGAGVDKFSYAILESSLKPGSQKVTSDIQALNFAWRGGGRN